MAEKCSTYAKLISEEKMKQSQSHEARKSLGKISVLSNIRDYP